MPDNPRPAPPFRLPGYGILAIAGRDAVKFAHAQCMSDVAALAPGHWQWSGWLTPKGRVVALFALLKLDPETLWLLLPDVAAEELGAQLQRYVFRSKLDLRPVTDMHAGGMFARPAHASADAFARRDDGGIELDLGADGGPRSLRIDPTPAAIDPRGQAEWYAFDLVHGLPRLPESQRGQWTPQQLSLERLRAFSVKKGCYPGQEIVARTHFLGQAKRGLVALRASGPLPVDAEVELDGTAIGRIISASPGGPCFALGVLSLERGTGALKAAGLGLDDIGLRDGLAR